MWSFEEITSKVHHIKSAESLELLLNYFVHIFSESLPSAHIVERWAQEAIHLALSCSSRHYAGRSFQVRDLSFLVHRVTSVESLKLQLLI